MRIYELHANVTNNGRKIRLTIALFEYRRNIDKDYKIGIALFSLKNGKEFSWLFSICGIIEIRRIVDL